MTDRKSSPVRGSRLGRLGQFGRLATGIAGGVIAEGARSLASGKRPALRDMVITPGNITRIADEMARLRGAAMKVGQLLSMDTGNALPPELADLLARLRADADAMPMQQLAPVLVQAWGPEWPQQFRRFDQRPRAAASIGQVHYAEFHDHQPLAIKVQYPGVARSIDSDVDNLATLLRMTRLLPKSLDLAPLLAEAKVQLHAETDYQREAAAQQRFAERLQDDPHFTVAKVHAELSTAQVLTMDYMPGQPVEALVNQPQTLRDTVMQRLFELLFRELFVWGEVQTDPNLANFLYQAEQDRLVLLDFGAVRAYDADMVAAYRELLHAGQTHNTASMLSAATRIGYFAQDIQPAQQRAVLALFELACEPLRQQGAYDFGTSDLAVRVREAGMAMSFEQDYWHSPPVAALFLHRKIAGLYLLAARLQARVDVGAILAPFLSSTLPDQAARVPTA
ncbi:ABC1 kinase family protein [Salinispirillum marinum]|uniref:ABC1 kinase family protein n=2 Tax=Saccharospirillaceae TaxID=255527 RepID=A0ABV8BAQ3_9GAMM